MENCEDQDMASYEELIGNPGWLNKLNAYRKKFAALAEYQDATTYYDRLKILRNFYLANEEEIVSLSKKNLYMFFISYPIDWLTLFTPIEKDAWESIRIKGRLVLYPQYPVLNYHVDFGNPRFKIALEIDGKQFHNIEKDKARDKVLKEHGWTVIRISGSEMVNLKFKDDLACSQEGLGLTESLSHVKHWLLKTGDGVIESIKRIYFMPPPPDNWDDCDDDFFVNEWAVYNLCQESLNNHKIV